MKILHLWFLACLLTACSSTKTTTTNHKATQEVSTTTKEEQKTNGTAEQESHTTQQMSIHEASTANTQLEAFEIVEVWATDENGKSSYKKTKRTKHKTSREIKNAKRSDTSASKSSSLTSYHKQGENATRAKFDAKNKTKTTQKEATPFEKWKWVRFLVGALGIVLCVFVAKKMR